MGNNAELQVKSSEDINTEAAGYKYLANAMQQQYKNLTLQQEIAQQEELNIYLNNESEQMRLELANLLTEPPQIIEAMEAGNPAPSQQEKEEPMDALEVFHDQRRLQEHETRAELSQEDTTIRKECEIPKNEPLGIENQSEQRV